MKPRLAVAACFTLACALAAPALAAAKPLGHCNLEASLCSRPFNDVVLPATHNSMSAQSLGWHLPNQPVPIRAQLHEGVRGFLIDTHYGDRRPDGVIITDDDGTKNAGPRGLYLCHEYCELGASKLVQQLRYISEFLQAHPHNVLMLDVEDYVTPADFAGAMQRSGLLAHLYTGAPGPTWPTVQWMIRNQQQVVVLAEHDSGSGAYPWYHQDYEGIVQETPYTFKTADLLEKRANWPASCQPNRGGTTGSLFLMNHWSPPTPQDQPDLAAYAKLNSKKVLVGRAEKCASSRGMLPTIVAVDQFESGGLFEAVQKLNALEGQGLQAPR